MKLNIDSWSLGRVLLLYTAVLFVFVFAVCWLSYLYEGTQWKISNPFIWTAVFLIYGLLKLLSYGNILWSDFKILVNNPKTKTQEFWLNVYPIDLMCLVWIGNYLAPIV